MRVRLFVPAAVLALALAFGCSHPADRGAPPRKGRGPQVRAFTESSSVRTIATASGYLFVGTTRGLDRWDLRTGEYLFVGEPAGLPGTSVVALHPTAKGEAIWIATDAGVALYDVATESVAQVPPPIPAHAAALKGLTALAPDPSGGAWIGGSVGLYHVDLDGVWRPAGFTSPVTALWLARDGALWMGTTGGVAVRHTDGSFTRYDQNQGLGITTARQILEGPDGQPIVIGNAADGRSRLAFFAGDAFTTYRPSPEVPIAGGARRGDDVVLATTRDLFVVSSKRGGARTLSRDGLHLVPVAGKRKRSPYLIDKLAVPVPPDPTALTSTGGEVLVGTSALGVARVSEGRGKQPTMRWLRRMELVTGAVDLTVACASANDCYVATGSDRTWRFDGASFRPIQVAAASSTITLAVVHSPEGGVLALYRVPGERQLRVARLEGATFNAMTELTIETPGGVTGLSFAKFSPDGLLWLGLMYLDEENEARPYGVATIDLTLGAVSYHHERRGNDSKKTGILPVPNDVVDAAFLEDEIWFASASGAARLRGEELTVYTEAEGLESEILHGVVATEGGLVFVATTGGVEVFDGTRWTSPKALRMVVRGITRGRDGRLWMATDRGVVAYDGQRAQRTDRRAGLLEDRVEDIAVDDEGRVWSRSRQGFSLVTP